MKIQIQIKGDAQTARLYVSGKRRESDGETEIRITREEARRLLCAALDWRLCGWKSCGGFDHSEIVESLTGRRVYLIFPRLNSCAVEVASTLNMVYECARDSLAVHLNANA